MKSRFTILQIFKQGDPVLLAIVFLSVTTGSRLNQKFNTLILENPVLLIAFPAFINGIAANILAGLIFQKVSSWIPTLIIIIVAGETATFAMSLVGTIIIRIGYYRGLDPDTITSPVCTTGGDLVGTFMLLFLANLLF